MVNLFTIINTVVFIFWIGADEARFQFMMDNFTVSWMGLELGRYWTVVTSVFSHNFLLHFLINMLVLRSFGGLIESVLGRFRFLRFYLFAGILGSLGHAFVSAFIVGSPDLPALGASGAIAGLVLLFSLLFPRERILIFGLIPVPAILGAFLLMGIDIWGLVAQAEGGGLPIGHGAHLGGAVAGIIYFFRWRKRLRPPIFF